MRITLRSNADPDRDVLKGLCQEIFDPWFFFRVVNPDPRAGIAHLRAGIAHFEGGNSSF
jgi:hypothetical protein